MMPNIFVDVAAHRELLSVIRLPPPSLFSGGANSTSAAQLSGPGSDNLVAEGKAGAVRDPHGDAAAISAGAD
jgi:hypothetical protein